MLLASPSRVRYQHRALQRWCRACGAGETAGEHPHARDQHRSSIGTVIRLVIVDIDGVGDDDDDDDLLVDVDGGGDDDDDDDLLVVLVESSRSSSSSSSRAGARNAQEIFLTRLAKTNYRSMQLRCEHPECWPAKMVSLLQETSSRGSGFVRPGAACGGKRWG